MSCKTMLLSTVLGVLQERTLGPSNNLKVNDRFYLLSRVFGEA